MRKTKTETEPERSVGQLTKARLLLEGAQSALQEEFEHLTETIERLEGILEFAKHRKKELENSLIKNRGPLKDTKEIELTKGSHSKREMQGAGPAIVETFKVKGKQISLTAEQVEDLKAAYKADKERNPRAGPNGAVKKVLVDPGLIPPHHANNAWNAAARIVGHLTPAQKRARQSRTR